MFNKIFLHIGLPKTGTTYLQNAFDALSREALLSQTSYPVFNGDCDPTHIQSGNGEAIAYQLLTEHVPVFCAQTVKTLIDNLLAAADQSKANLLISSEHFSNAEPSRMQYVLDVLKGHAAAVEVIVFLRPVDRLCHSRYHQEVKRHAESRRYDASFFNAFCTKLLRQVAFIGNLPCTVHVVDYRMSGLLAVILRMLGEDPSLQVPFTDTVVNRSLTKNELQLLRQINSIFKRPELSTSISDRWIYANPHAKSVREQTESELLFSVCKERVSERADDIAAPTCQAMLNLLMPLRTTGEGEAEHGRIIFSAEDQPTNEDLMQMALEEIAKLMQMNDLLGEYTEQLVPTRDAFDPVHYLLLNQDVLVAKVDPVKHFKQFGYNERRFTSFITIPKFFDK